MLVLSDEEEVRATFAVKKDSKKYIAQYHGSNIAWEELFDLARDPEESVDLSGKDDQRQILNELRSEVSSHIRMIGVDLEEIERKHKLMSGSSL